MSQTFGRFRLGLQGRCRTPPLKGSPWGEAMAAFAIQYLEDDPGVAEIVPDEETFRKISQNANSKSVQKMRSRQEYLAMWKETEDELRQFQQTFMPFLSAQPKLNIPDNYKLIEEQESP